MTAPEETLRNHKEGQLLIKYIVLVLWPLGLSPTGTARSTEDIGQNWRIWDDQRWLWNCARSIIILITIHHRSPGEEEKVFWDAGQGQRKTLLMTDINNDSDSMEARQRQGRIPVQEGLQSGTLWKTG